ncbi:thioredoxin reductase GliT-like protein [Aspergillus nomiae NRRL 13137]|uniref:Thioredoxin reductase GliT-like protein n=1 Tax=Aspergillus nomiae NRRL (strain ATCC 15546 / NRRL 13137 / CBS 260.88 / M93) TaxID=1509407 RepID=A0A0L1ITS9_ASPN3|nr:thioredoxin reductase GliT-like protein [Aspergillus nomiae NRRL 13137]KNG82810.1 thioredoxin reductase GliT-like protein [Aspergillus nomiae NRRL 13137]
MTLYDVLIIGGGPAGLSVATGLARQLYRAVVFDSGVYRNALSNHMHNVATWDHSSPADFRREARERILARYDTIRFEDLEIKRVQKTSEGYFKAFDARDGVWTGRKLVLANGVRDVFPDIDGYRECWGTGIFHCLFCHGYEERGCASAGLLAVGDVAEPRAAMHFARMARRFSTTVTVYTDGAEELAHTLEESASGTGIKVDRRKISKLVKGPGASDVQIVFEDGTQVTEGFLTHKPKTESNAPFAEQLGLQLAPTADIETTAPFYSTSVPGVFAAGDCAVPVKVVAMAMASGVSVAGGLAGQLQDELYPAEQK